MIKIEVCMGTHCSMMGSLNLYEDLEEVQEDHPDQIELEMVKCLKVCESGKAPVIKLNDKIMTSVKSEEVVSEILELIKQ